ncbi:MAG: sensor histidine kinase KdpD [Oscillospiraceae bacterium]|nr:sensor histidine kinase KdpD [Oscillospiraceae bacterium]MBP5167661.1 sensor histidine kinase KdpD [Oscillospiraceae bacterium]
MEKVLESGERILVCLSSSPSNKKVIDAAARMAEAFHAALSAIYVKPANYDSFPESDKIRLQNNITFAEQNGATIITIIGNDVPVQIAEYAHISGTTKIVVGRSGAKRQYFWSKASLTEQIILNAPDVDVFIIPDSSADLKQQSQRLNLNNQIRPTWRDSLITLLLLIVSTSVGLLFTLFGFSEANIITVFILGVLIIAVFTVSPIYSIVSSMASVLLFNWFFIEPKFSFHTYEPEYAVTFVIMLVSSLITGSLANKLKENARQSSREAFRAKVLFDTNQLLQKAECADDVIRITAQQVKTLLDRDVVVFPFTENKKLGNMIELNTFPYYFRTSGQDDNEAEIAEWAFINQTAAGTHTEKYEKAKSLYYPICINGYCYGVIAIYLNGESLEAFEYSVFSSIIGECALALEGIRNAAEKEQAAIAVRNEQLRSNLLRSISHDIRTPLTSISGNASNLLTHYEQLDTETLKQVFTDIYDDSEWLIDLVENLLSISRIENGQMDLHLSLDVIDDVIEEALRHIDKNAAQHHIIVQPSRDVLIARMDARLITQVLINLINNAIKNTQIGSEIRITSEQADDCICVHVEDNGPGIPDNMKPHIFEMFYTGQNQVTDGRRGIGLGLALCKSIVEAHGGSIILSDNTPTGCCFTFSLPVEEVTINE